MFDAIVVWGLFIQILILQGLCRWIEETNISEKDDGFKEAKSLYHWIFKQLAGKECLFCYNLYSKNDRVRLKPLCEYLYSTDVGQFVQDHLFKKQLPMKKLPPELDTPEAKKIFQKAIKESIMTEDYKFESMADASIFAYWYNVSVWKKPKYEHMNKGKDLNSRYKWKPFESLFGCNNLANKYRKDGQYKDAKKIKSLFY